MVAVGCSTSISTSAVVLLTLAVVGVYFLVRKRRVHRNDENAALKKTDNDKLDSKQRASQVKSQFQKWKEDNETMQRNGKVETTLEQQIELASRLWNEASGKMDASVTAAQTHEILEALKKTPIHDTDSIVSWKGFRVGWFLDVFCKTPYMQKLLEFGCELWFVRKVCVIAFIRQAHCTMNKDTTNAPVLSGPFVNFMDTVISGFGLEGDTDKIVKTPTTFISYTGGYTMQETLDMLRQLDPKEIVWMDVFCVNQFAWTGKSRSAEMKQFKESFLEDLKNQIQKINNTVLVVADWKNAMATLGQIWVLWEIFCTAEGGQGLNVVLPPSQAHDFVQNCLESSENFDGIMSSLASIDANLARAEDGADQQVIFARMQKVGLSKVNNVASSAVREWLYRQGQDYLIKRCESQDGPSALLLHNLARLLSKQGKLEEAEPLFLEALEKRLNNLGCDHPDTLASLDSLAGLLWAQGKLDEAESLFREALKKSQKVLGHDHPDTLTSVNNLARLLQDQGKSEEAEPLFWEYLEKNQKVLGSDHPNTLTSIGNLASFLREQGRLDEAEPLHREALKTKRKLLGRDHPSTLVTIGNLASMLQDQGKLREAEPLFREALEKCQKVLGGEHSCTLISLNNLAGLLHDQNKLDEAEEKYREALEKYEKVLGRDHKYTLISVGNLARLLQDQGKLEEAEPLYREALETEEKLLGRDHPSTLVSMCNLAVLLHQLGGSTCLEESKALLWECKTTSPAKLGAAHPHTNAIKYHWDRLFGSATE